MSEVAVAIPVRDGGARLVGVLEALSRQSVAHELVVCDSGSSDGSVEAARAHGARVISIEPESFNHGGTRNLLMRESSAAHVALLTQDSEPADERWLERLLGAFERADDVALAYGPYLAREDAEPYVRWELERWFASLPAGAERLDASAVPGELVGRRGFFTSANACLSRAAWEQVPFREVSCAEDRALALDMLRAGYAKVYVPRARVLHSHGYRAGEELRRGFDEWRGLLEVYGWREPASPPALARRLRGELAADRRAAHAEGMPAGRRRRALLQGAWRRLARLAGALLGSRADRLPAPVRASLSREGRAGFEPQVGP